MNKTLRRLNRKCIYKTGFTLKQFVLIIGIAVFVVMWITGSLPNNYDYALDRIYNF